MVWKRDFYTFLYSMINYLFSISYLALLLVIFRHVTELLSLTCEHLDRPRRTHYQLFKQVAGAGIFFVLIISAIVPQVIYLCL